MRGISRSSALRPRNALTAPFASFWAASRRVRGAFRSRSRRTSRPAGSLNGYKAIVQDPDIGTDPTEKFTWRLEDPVPPGFAISADGTLSFDAVAGKEANGKNVTIVVTDSAGAAAKQTFDVRF